MATDVSAVVEGGNQFGLNLYQRLRAAKGNVFFSPISISLALAMTYAGSAGNTEAEMAKTLNLRMPKREIHDGMAALQAAWRTSEAKQGFRLNVANRLWGQRSYAFLPDFLAVTREKYGAELATADFENNAEAARQEINRWVEEQTAKKIVDFFSSAGALQGSRLVLVNAVHFKGDWTFPFDKKGVKDCDFFVSPTETVKAPLMHKLGSFRYAAGEGMQFLELPYGDRRLSMVVALPAKVDGLNDLESKLSAENLQNWLRKMRMRQVEVLLPKFRIGGEFKLKSALESLGMTTAFEPSRADFSAMTGGRDLFISAAVHKAFVEVNEEGAEAAAATGISMAPTSAVNPDPPTPEVFRADHPFVFLIRDNRNGAILFLGRVADPTR